MIGRADDVLPFHFSIQPADLVLRSYATAASWVLHSSTKAPKGAAWTSRGSGGRAAERSCRAIGEPSPRFARIPGGAKVPLPRLSRPTPELAAAAHRRGCLGVASGNPESLHRNPRSGRGSPPVPASTIPRGPEGECKAGSAARFRPALTR